jgi:hypothetical protein
MNMDRIARVCVTCSWTLKSYEIAESGGLEELAGYVDDQQHHRN